MSQIFLFTGENEYELRKERSRWVAEFSEKHGAENILVTDAKGLTLATFMDELCIAPFIAEKRLVIVSGLPKLDKEQYSIIEQSIHPQVVLVFVDPKPDKRLSFAKEVLKHASVKTFTPLRGVKLSQWLTSLAQEHGASFQPSEAAFLLEVVGESQALLANEIEKLSTHANGGQITRDQIEHLVMLSVEQAGWKLMDLLAASNTAGALAFAHSLQKRGESPFALWNMFLWIVSQLGLVGAATLDGLSSPQDIAKRCGVSPMTAKNLLRIARSMDKPKLTALIKKVTEADMALKTGGYRTTADAPEELASLIDSSIAAVSAS